MLYHPQSAKLNEICNFAKRNMWLGLPTIPWVRGGCRRFRKETFYRDGSLRKYPEYFLIFFFETYNKHENIQLTWEMGK
jgi:hypothetical protein